VRVSNSGSDVLAVSGMTVSAAEFSVPDAPSFSVAPAGHRDVRVRYGRSSAGAASGTLSITSNDPAIPTTVVGSLEVRVCRR